MFKLFTFTFFGIVLRKQQYFHSCRFLGHFDNLCIKPKQLKTLFKKTNVLLGGRMQDEPPGQEVGQQM